MSCLTFWAAASCPSVRHDRYAWIDRSGAPSFPSFLFLSLLSISALSLLRTHLLLRSLLSSLLIASSSFRFFVSYIQLSRHTTMLLRPYVHTLRHRSEPALDCANSDIGDLSSRSRSGSVSTLNELILPHFSSSSSSSASSPSTSSSASLASPPLDNQPQAMSTFSINDKRRPNLTSFVSHLMTTWNHSHLTAHNDEDTQEVLSTSSLSSPISPISPATPTSIHSASCLPSPTQRSVSYSAFWQSSYGDGSLAQKKGSPRAKNVQLSPPPPKRSRSNTVNACLKTSLALQNVTEKTRQNINEVTPRKRDSNLSLRDLPAFTFGSVKGDVGQSSLKSPRSPLSHLSFSPQMQLAELEDEKDTEVKCARSATTGTTAGGSSFSSPLLPHTLSSDLSMPTTPLTPLHTIYIDHIAVAYNPASSSGQECKKLLMRLERFKKRSSVDLSSLSIEKASMVLNAVNGNSHNASTGPAAAVEGEGLKKSPHSTPTFARISRRNSAGTVNASPSSAPHLNKATSGHGQSFKVTAKIRDHHEANSIEVSSHKSSAVPTVDDSINTLADCAVDCLFAGCVCGWLQIDFRCYWFDPFRHVR